MKSIYDFLKNQQGHTLQPQQPPHTSRKYTNKACVDCKLAHVACDNQRPCKVALVNKRCIRLNRQDTCTDAVRKKRGRPENSGKVKQQVEFKIRSRPLLPNSQKPTNLLNSVPVISQLVPKVVVPTVAVPATASRQSTKVPAIPVPEKPAVVNQLNNAQLDSTKITANAESSFEDSLPIELPTEQLLANNSFEIDDNLIEILKKWLPKIQNNPGEFANVENPQDFDELVLTFATLQKLQG